MKPLEMCPYFIISPHVAAISHRPICSILAWSRENIETGSKMEELSGASICQLQGAILQISCCLRFGWGWLMLIVRRLEKWKYSFISIANVAVIQSLIVRNAGGKVKGRGDFDWHLVKEKDASQASSFFCVTRQFVGTSNWIFLEGPEVQH